MKKFFNDLKLYRAYIFHATRSNLMADVAESNLKWIWWILEPLCFMLVYTFVALVVFGKGEPYFPLFVFVGLNIWNLFQSTVKSSVKMVRSTRSIISRVYIPKYVLVLISLSENFFKLIITFLLVFAAMPFFKVKVTWNVFLLIPVFIVAIVLTFGVSCWLLDLGVFFEDLSKLVNVVLRLVFYLTGIFFNISKRVAEPFGTLLLKVNPMAFLIDGARNCLLYEKGINYRWLIAWFVAGIVLSITGIYRIIKNENTYVKII